MAPAFFSLLTRDLLETSCSPPKGLIFFVDIINAQGHQRRWWKYFPKIGISEIRVWARSAGPQCSVLPWENQPDSFCNLSDWSDQKSTGLNSEQNNRRWWFLLIIKCRQKNDRDEENVISCMPWKKENESACSILGGFWKDTKGRHKKTQGYS